MTPGLPGPSSTMSPSLAHDDVRHAERPRAAWRARRGAAPRRAPGRRSAAASTHTCCSISSRRGWPETWTSASRSVRTSTPLRISELMMRADRLLVAGDGARGEDHEVARGERHVRMLVLGDAGQRGARLALAAGQQRHDLVARQVAVGVRAAERRQPVEVAAIVARPRSTRSMARPTTTHLAAAAARRLRDGADARDVGREGRHRDAARRLAR